MLHVYVRTTPRLYHEESHTLDDGSSMIYIYIYLWILVHRMIQCGCVCAISNVETPLWVIFEKSRISILFEVQCMKSPLWAILWIFFFCIHFKNVCIKDMYTIRGSLHQRNKWLYWHYTNTRRLETDIPVKIPLVVRRRGYSSRTSLKTWNFRNQKINDFNLFVIKQYILHAHTHILNALWNELG